MVKADLTIKDKVEHALQEARVILPGTEALLGFQLVSFFSGTDRLVNGLKYWHLASFGFILLGTIFLVAPVAYHRIGEKGHETESFYFFAATMLVLAMVMLAFGLSADIYVIVSLVSNSTLAAGWSAAVAFVLMTGLWFGYSFYRRIRNG